jgi:phosphoribosylformylglycinamidine synthase
MFAQANSEHCRHKIFNASWVIDGQARSETLFGMIRETHQAHPAGTIVAYADNSSVIEGACVPRFHPGPDGRYAYHEEPTHILAKVETHNHPTAISPFPGAATGSGGEIRDEGATGRGSKPKAGLCGFSVSNLNIPDFLQPWELPSSRLWPPGAHRFAAGDHARRADRRRRLQQRVRPPEPGRLFPHLRAVHRQRRRATAARLPQADHARRRRRQHRCQPVASRPKLTPRHPARPDRWPGHADRPRRRCRQLDDHRQQQRRSRLRFGAARQSRDPAACAGSHRPLLADGRTRRRRVGIAGDGNPILSVHDVGAGGISNALPELAHGAGSGARFELRAVHIEEPGMSPAEIWCNEAQERYVLAIAPEPPRRVRGLCERERCPFAVVGVTTARNSPGGCRPSFRQPSGRHGHGRAARQAAAHDAHGRRICHR